MSFLNSQLFTHRSYKKMLPSLTCWSRSTKMFRGMVHLFYVERLRQLGLAAPEKSHCGLSVPERDLQDRWTDCSGVETVTGQGVEASDWLKGGLRQRLGRNFFLWGWETLQQVTQTSWVMIFNDPWWSLRFLPSQTILWFCALKKEYSNSHFKLF